MSEPSRSTKPCLFNVTLIKGNFTKSIFRYDWIVVGEDGIPRPKNFQGAPEKEDTENVYIYDLSPSHCRDLKVDIGTSIKYDGHSMQFVDRETVKRIINL